MQSKLTIKINKYADQIDDDIQEIGYNYLFEFTFDGDSTITITYNTLSLNATIEGHSGELTFRDLNAMLDYCFNYVDDNNPNELKFEKKSNKEFYLVPTHGFHI